MVKVLLEEGANVGAKNKVRPPQTAASAHLIHRALVTSELYSPMVYVLCSQKGKTALELGFFDAIASVDLEYVPERHSACVHMLLCDSYPADTEFRDSVSAVNISLTP